MFSNSHLHSIFSDDSRTPKELVQKAKAAGYKALILTDHDTVRGSESLFEEAKRAGMLSMLGCEITTNGFGECIHVLAFDFDPENKDMKALMKRGSQRQTTRSEILFREGLKRGSLRSGVTWEEVVSAFSDNDYLCNTQVFDVLLKKGIYRPEERREYWLANFGYELPLSRELDKSLPPFADTDEAISIIRRAGGVPMIAHPHGLIKYADDILKMGVLGFETHHPELDGDDIEFFENFCLENSLYQSGGTDHEHILPVNEAVGYASEENFMKLYRRELG